MSASYTGIFNLIKPEIIDSYDISQHNTNSDTIDSALAQLMSFTTASGSGTAITYSRPTVKALLPGMSFTFVALANNNGASTTFKVNDFAAQPLYKPGTTDAPTIVAGKAYTVWTNGTNFFLKASAEGNATAAHVLAPYTFSSDNGTFTGTIPSKSAQTYTPGTSNQTIAANQFLSGAQTILGDADLLAGNIKAQVEIFGVTGTFTSDANATASDVLATKTCYVNGVKITGNIASKGAQTYTPGTTNQTIAANQYLTGIQTILGDANLTSNNVKANVTIFGITGNSNVVDTSSGTATAAQILSGQKAWVDGVELTGSMTNNGALGTYTPGTTNQTIPAGYSTGGTILGDADLTAANIKKDVTIFNITGTLEASGITFAYGLPPF